MKNSMGIWWFRVHATVQVAMVALSTAGFVIIISAAGGSSIFTTVHGTIGIFVFVLSVGQILLGITSDCLWTPQRALTPVIPDKIHWVIGWLLILAGPINVLLGIFFVTDAAGYPKTAIGFQIAYLVIVPLLWIWCTYSFPQVHHNAEGYALLTSGSAESTPLPVSGESASLISSDAASLRTTNSFSSVGTGSMHKHQSKLSSNRIIMYFFFYVFVSVICVIGVTSCLQPLPVTVSSGSGGNNGLVRLTDAFFSLFSTFGK